MAGGYRPQPQGIEAIVAKFRESEKVQADLRKMITGFGLTVDPQGNLIFDAASKNIIIKNGSGIQVLDDGSVSIDGSLTVGGNATLAGDLTATSGTLKSGNYVAGASGWRLLPSGNVEINDITLRGGIVGDDALANPVTGGRCDATATGITLTTSFVDRQSSTIAVPAGFSTALVMATVQIGGSNSSGANNNLLCAAVIGSTVGDTTVESSNSTFVSHAVASLTATLTGLSGGNITVAARGSCQITPNLTGQTARVSALAIFLR